VWGDNTCTPGTPTAETCNNVDDNCDGSIDEGCDDDGDGYCDKNMTVSDEPVNECPESLDGPGDDCNDNDPNLYPVGPAVRIVRIPPQYYSLFQESYNNSVSDEIIQIKNSQLAESIILDRSISLTLEAGYNCDFTILNGKATVNGNLTVSEGMFIIQNGTLQLQ
jgi:hypothetical protein